MLEFSILVSLVGWTWPYHANWLWTALYALWLGAPVNQIFHFLFRRFQPEIEIDDATIEGAGATDNPQQFIDNEEGFFRRKMQQMNTSHYGTPFSISTAGLDISLKNLLAILQDYKQKADLQDMAHETHTFPSFQRDFRLN